MTTISTHLRKLAIWFFATGLEQILFVIGIVCAIGAVISLVWALCYYWVYTVAWGIILLLGLLIQWAFSWIGRKFFALQTWAKVEQKKATANQTSAEGIYWSGTGPGEEWYIVSESGGASAGPTTLENAQEALSRFNGQWGKCKLVHQNERDKDPIRDDLKAMQDLVNKDRT